MGEAPINGVVQQKLGFIADTRAKLASLGPVTAEMLREDWQLRMVVERGLQVAVEAAVDVCHRLISLAGQPPATTATDAIERCVTLGALTGRDNYRRMVQFRNFIVHRYERVDEAVLARVLSERLADLDRFIEEVSAHARRGPR
jgi:uncharacterized protein YutE (UPF0331/DUF86 family)